MHRNPILRLVAMLLFAGVVVIFLLLIGNGANWAAPSIAFVLAITSVLIALLRGGARSYAFWAAVLSAYPPASPFIVRYALGLPYFSARSQDALQVPGGAGSPLILAAAASVIIGLSVSARTAVSPGHLIKARAHAPILLGLAAASMLFFAWLTEPGLPIGVASDYAAIRAGRISGTNFAGGAWVVAAAMSVLLLRTQSSRTGNQGRMFTGLVWGSLVLSSIWLLVHARRSELSGLLVFGVFLTGRRFWSRRVLVWLFPLVLLLAAVGYVRNPDALANYRTHGYVQLPGAPGNIILNWIATYNLVSSPTRFVAPGATYAALVHNIPPRILGLERAPEFRDYLIVPFPALRPTGQYVLDEPFANFGILGVLGFLVLFVLGTNASVRAVRRYLSGFGSLFAALVGADFLMLVFRTMWYGLDALVSGTVMAVAVGAIVLLLAASRRGVRRLRTSSSLPREAPTGTL